MTIKLVEVLYLREQSIYDDVNSKTKPEHLNSEAGQSNLQFNCTKSSFKKIPGQQECTKKGIMQ